MGIGCFDAYTTLLVWRFGHLQHHGGSLPSGFFSRPTSVPWTFDMYLVLFCCLQCPNIMTSLSPSILLHPFLVPSLILSQNFILCCDMYTTCNWRRGRNSSIDYVFIIILSNPNMKVKKPLVSSSTIMLMVVQGMFVLGFLCSLFDFQKTKLLQIITMVCGDQHLVYKYMCCF
jgi:hypothetical protein